MAEAVRVGVIDPFSLATNEQRQRALRREIDRLQHNWRTLMFTDVFLYRDGFGMEPRPLTGDDVELQKELRNAFIRFTRWFHRLPAVDAGTVYDSETLTLADHASYLKFVQVYGALQTRVAAAGRALELEVNAGPGDEMNVPPPPEGFETIPPWAWALAGAGVLWWVSNRQKGGG